MAFEYWLHCDDIGISKKSVQSIWPLYRAGALRGASLFVNGPGCDDFLKLVALNPSPVRVAAHLTLTNGPSALSHLQIPLLVDSRDRFCHGFIWFLLANFFHPQKKELRRQVSLEMAAQLEKFQSKLETQKCQSNFLGYDGHNHIHAIPMVYQELKKGFPVIRGRTVLEPIFWSKNIQDQLSFRYLSNWPKLVLLRTLNFWNVRKQNSKRACLGILYSGLQNTQTLRAGISRSQKLGIEELEVIVHSLEVDTNDHEGDFFGQDLLDFLRSPARALEAQAVLAMETHGQV